MIVTVYYQFSFFYMYSVIRNASVFLRLRCHFSCLLRHQALSLGGAVARAPQRAVHDDGRRP